MASTLLLVMGALAIHHEVVHALERPVGRAVSSQDDRSIGRVLEDRPSHRIRGKGNTIIQRIDNAVSIEALTFENGG